MPSRIQPFVISLVIGILLPAVFAGGLAINAAVIVTIAAIVLWVVKVVERPQPELLIAVFGLIFGLVAGVVLAPLLGVPDAAAVVIVLSAVLM